MRPLVSLEGVSFAYAGALRPSLRDVNLGLERGECVAAAGPVGAGTSTLLLVAAGFAPRVIPGTLRGTQAVSAVRPAVVFATPWTQLTGLCDTVRAEVAFGPAAHGLQRNRVLDLADEAMAALGIAHLAERDPASLSGGELQRVILASALAMDPDLLILDDPSAELDPDAADTVFDILTRVARSGVGVLVATTDWDRAARAAGRALWMEEGRIVRQGSPGEVFA